MEEKGFVGKHYLMKQAFGQEELHKREAVCTREDLPACMDTCPLEIDMRSVCAYVAKGDFTKAAGVIRTATPFLFLLSKNCGGACTKACILSKMGDGISLQALERACALYGGAGTINRFMLPKKKQKVAVIGDDLFALACCWELGKKGYEVFWYTVCITMEEALNGWGLTEEEKKLELRAFGGLRIERKTQEQLLKENLPGWAEGMDGVIVSPELLWTGILDGIIKVERREKAEQILAEARYAALMTDRQMQGVQIDQEKREKKEKSRLFVTLDGVEGSKTVTDIEHVTKEGAVEEAKRCIQCQCLECVKGCAYLQHYKRNPKAAIREIYNNMSIVMGNHMANGMINACDECGQCKAACPNGFDYPDVCKIAKHTMVETKKMPPSTHEFALLDQEFSNGEAFLAKAQPGYQKCRYLFFPGCQAAAVSPGTVEAAYRDLLHRLEGGVGLLLGCCGAISKWAAREDLLKASMEQFTKVWQKMGEPELICACPTCKQVFEEYTKVRTVGIWEVLLDLGVEKVTSKKVALHDACGARGNQKMQEEVRAFVKALGIEVAEVPFEGDLAPCCGYGGLVKYANKEVSIKKAKFAADRSAYPVLTYCMGCRDQFQRVGADSCHILELSYGVEPLPVPDLSARRANRLLLKQRLLKEIWNEDWEVDVMLPVVYQDGVKEQMEERMILESDVQEVLKAYEDSGEAVFDEESQCLVANYRMGNVTFWVRFTKNEKEYVVQGAYSHRMTVE